jgi:hypothetical protein
VRKANLAIIESSPKKFECSCKFVRLSTILPESRHCVDRENVAGEQIPQNEKIYSTGSGTIPVEPHEAISTGYAGAASLHGSAIVDSSRKGWQIGPQHAPNPARQEVDGLTLHQVWRSPLEN